MILEKIVGSSRDLNPGPSDIQSDIITTELLEPRQGGVGYQVPIKIGSKAIEHPDSLLDGSQLILHSIRIRDQHGSCALSTTQVQTSISTPCYTCNHEYFTLSALKAMEEGSLAKRGKLAITNHNYYARWDAHNQCGDCGFVSLRVFKHAGCVTRPVLCTATLLIAWLVDLYRIAQLGNDCEKVAVCQCLIVSVVNDK